MTAFAAAADDSQLPAHSALGASGAARWLACPGSFALSRTERPRAASIHAATGTLAHTLIEQALRAYLATPDDANTVLGVPLGQTVNVDGHDVLLNQELIDGVQVMVDYITRVLPDYELGCRVEQTVFLDKYFPRNAPPPVRLFGRADVQLLSCARHALEVVDYKNGAGVLVSPRDNPQLLYYAAGALAMLSPEMLAATDTVRLTVVQPNARDQDKVRSWDTTVLDVLIWVDTVLLPGVRAVQAKNAPLNPGAWCRFCPVAHGCPQLVQDAQDAARREFASEGDILAEHLDLAERVERWVNAVREFAAERIGKGETVPGWGLVPTRPVRAWADPDMVETALRGVFEPTDLTVFYRHDLLSPAQIEKLLLKRNQRAVWRVLRSHVLSQSSGLKLARDNGSPDDDDIVFNLINP